VILPDGALVLLVAAGEVDAEDVLSTDTYRGGADR
jgi:hypothetical protein